MSQDTAEQAKIRLLRCDTCKTLEELPDFDGPPEYDVALNFLLGQHRTPEGHPHIGRLIDVEKRAWDLPNLREALLEQIKAGVSPGLDVFGTQFYAVRDTFKEDAAACYSLHNRPKEGCSDWRSDRKRLVPDTKEERKDVGLSMEGAPKMWLCDFCVVRSYYERKSRGD